METLKAQAAAENEIDGKLPHVLDPLFEKLKNTFLQDYLPVSKYHQGVIFKSTEEIYQLFYRLYPDPLAFFPSSIARFLNDNGYKMYNMGELRYEWMLLAAPAL